jgi:hypothetical protein
MQRLDEQVVRCLQRLQAKEFEPLVEWIRESRKGTLEQLATAKQENVGRLQGEAGVLGEILQDIQGSNDLITKLTANRKG